MIDQVGHVLNTLISCIRRVKFVWLHLWHKMTNVYEQSTPKFKEQVDEEMQKKSILGHKLSVILSSSIPTLNAARRSNMLWCGD